MPEEELKQNEQRSTIFESSYDGIVIEADERIRYVNKSYTRSFGYDELEELIENISP